ncbi:unnamed protein product [Rotaria magnacalcarata]
MMDCIFDDDTSPFLPKTLVSVTNNYETDSFHYDYTTKLLNCKLLTKNPYRSYFKQVYPTEINEYELTDDMLDVLKSYTNSLSNKCYIKTNLNLLSENLDEIDWMYVNKLRSLIRVQKFNIISDKRNDYYYTNSFTSFTIDRLLVYSGNALLILKTENSTDKAKKNLANIWKWSMFTEEKEALLAVGTKLKILSVHYFGCKMQIIIHLLFTVLILAVVIQGQGGGGDTRKYDNGNEQNDYSDDYRSGNRNYEAERVWSSRYYQYEKWHERHEFILSFDPKPFTVNGRGSSDVGTYTVTDKYSTETNEIELIKTYVANTDDPDENLGHSVTIELTWDPKEHQFIGKWYVDTSMFRGEDQYELKFEKILKLTANSNLNNP